MCLSGIVCVSVFFISSVCLLCFCSVVVFFFKQKTAYEMRISDWSSDVCSSDLPDEGAVRSAVATLSESSAYWPTELLARGDAWVAQKDAEAGEREAEAARLEIGRASCRERVCQYV